MVTERVPIDDDGSIITVAKPIASVGDPIAAVAMTIAAVNEPITAVGHSPAPDIEDYDGDGKGPHRR